MQEWSLMPFNKFNWSFVSRLPVAFSIGLGEIASVISEIILIIFQRPGVLRIRYGGKFTARFIEYS